MPLPSNLRHFQRAEFREPDLVDAEAAAALDTVRALWQRPIRLTSDARTPERNKRIGGSPTSLHLAGRAFDFEYPASAVDAWDLVRAVYIVSMNASLPVELEFVNTNRTEPLLRGLVAAKSMAEANGVKDGELVLKILRAYLTAVQDTHVHLGFFGRTSGRKSKLLVKDD